MRFTLINSASTTLRWSFFSFWPSTLRSNWNLEAYLLKWSFQSVFRCFFFSFLSSGIGGLHELSTHCSGWTYFVSQNCYAGGEGWFRPSNHCHSFEFLISSNLYAEILWKIWCSNHSLSFELPALPQDTLAAATGINRNPSAIMHTFERINMI